MGAIVVTMALPAGMGNILIDNRGKGPDKINARIEIEKLRAVVETLDVTSVLTI